MFDKHSHEFRQHDDGPELPAHLAALEGQLARLSPAAPRIDRDRLMFDAGRASPDQNGRGIYIARPSWSGRAAHFSRRRFWPIATATMTAATLLLSAMLVWQSRQTRSDVQVAKPAQSRTNPENPQVSLAVVEPGRTWPIEWSPITSDSNYLAVRQVVLALGVAALDQTQSVALQPASPRGERPRSPATAREILEDFVPELARPAGNRS